MRSIWTAVLAGGAAGATTMHFLDRDAGRRRRARARELMDHATHVATHGIAIGARDLEHRLHGAVMAARTSTRKPKTDDDVITARVRSRLGHACSHPHAIEVSCRGGSVELTGPILEAEAEQVLRLARGTVGVHDVVDRLDRHGAPDGVPGLQGPTRAARRNPGYWPPATRLAVGSTGAGAIGENRWRWTITGPGGEGASVANEGTVVFETMLRLKSLVEVGKTSGRDGTGTMFFITDSIA